MNRYDRCKRPQCNDTAPAFLFDLDGTLIDNVYQHVLAWREALERLAPSPPSGAFTGGSGSWRATLPLPRVKGLSVSREVYFSDDPNERSLSRTTT